MMKYACVFALGLAMTSALSAQEYSRVADDTVKLAEAMAACVWKREPAAAKMLSAKDLKEDDPAAAKAGKKAFSACSDVYADHAVTKDGEVVRFNRFMFFTELRRQDPSAAPSLADEMKALKKSWNKEGGS